ncbi:MAG: S-layer homology domain-containing protein [Acidimicrobiales bacterium]
MQLRRRWTAAALAAALVAPLLTVGSAGAAAGPGPVGADTEVPIAETFTVAEGDGVGTAHGWPHISSDPVTGRSLIVYNTAVDDGDLVDSIHARVIDETGVIGADIFVNPDLPSAGFDEFEPPFASWNSTNSEWLVTWTDDAIVYGQRVDSDGTLIGDNFVIAASKSGVTTDADNDFSDIEHVQTEWSPEQGVYLVSWKARGVDGGVSFIQTILATVIDESGAWVLDGDAVDISEEEADDGVAVAYSSTSDVWAVSWQRDADGNHASARIVSVSSAGGGLFDIDFDTAPLDISTVGTGTDGVPELAWDSTRDRFMIIYRSDQGDGDQHFFNFIEPDGSFDEADAEQLGDFDGSKPFRARVAYSPLDDEYAVVSHVGPGGDNAGELFTWTVSGDGAASESTSVIDAVGDKRARAAVSYGGGCFRYTWWDLGEFWGEGDSLPDSVFALVECEGCVSFERGSDVFDDVPLNAFYDIPVGWLSYRELTTGTGPGEFSPLDGVTRGQLATFVWRLEGQPSGPLGSATFGDVAVGKFYDQAVGWMFAEGLTTGTSPTTFDPERVLTRGELATFLWRLAGEPDAALGSATFGDVAVGKFYDQAVGWMFAEGITTGTSPTTFDPERALNRGEMATFLFRYVGDTDCITVYGQ